MDAQRPASGPSRKKEIPNWVLWVALPAAIIAFIGAWKLVPFFLGDARASTQRAEVLAAFFGALAFAGVIAAILMQKRELELQREELDETQRILEKQNTQMAAQVETLGRQTFENTFFQALRFHRELIPTLHGRPQRALKDSTRRGDELYVGVSALTCAADVAVGLAAKLRTEHPHTDPSSQASGVFYKTCADFNCDLTAYFESLKQLLLLVDGAPVVNKDPYVGIIRAQLSKAEIILVLFYGTHDELMNQVLQRPHTWKSLVEKHHFFRGVGVPEQLMYLMDYYSGSAWGVTQPDQASGGEIATGG